MSNGIRGLNEMEVDAVSGAGRTNTKNGSYVAGNKWEQWIYDNFDAGLVSDGTGYGGSGMRLQGPACGRPA